MLSVLALLSSLLWGSSDFIAGRLSVRLRPAAVVGGSQAFGLVFMVVVATATSAWSAPMGYLPWAAVAAVSGGAGLVCFYAALASGPNGVVAPIASTGVLLPLGFAVGTGSRPAPWQWVGFASIIVGLVLASGPELHRDVSRRSVGLAAGSALMFGVALAAIAQGSQTSPVMTMTAMRIGACLMVFAAAIAFRTSGGARVRDVPALALVGAVDVGANLAYGVSTTYGDLAISAVLGSLYPLVTMFLAWWFLAERLRPIQYVGSAAVLSGVLLACAA